MEKREGIGQKVDITKEAPKGIAKVCPRCGREFVCRKDAPSLCQCAGIVLSERVRAYLKETYKDCLCRECLEEIRSKV